MKSLLRYGRFILPDGWQVAAMLAALAAGTGLGLVSPYLTGVVVTHIQQAAAPLLHHLPADRAAMAALPLLCLLLALAAVGSGAFGFLRGYLSELLAQRSMYRARSAIYEHLQRQSFDFFDRAETGQILSRATGDVETLRRMFSRAVPGAFAALLQFVGTAVILLSMDARLAGLVLLIAPLFAWTVLAMSRRIRPASWALQQQLADLTTVLQEDVSAIRVVKAFARGDHEKARFATENRAYLDRSMDVARIQARYQPLLSQLPTLGTVLLLAFGGFDVLAGRLSLGMFVAFNAYVITLLAPLRMIGFLVSLGAQAAASADRIFEVLDSTGSVRQPAGAIALGRLQGEVRFEGVSAGYGHSAQLALADVDLTVKAGERVALVGMTGSGKSTLVQLVPRFYDPAKGRVFVDGHDLRTVDLQDLRGQIGFVLQDTFLFSASIEDNIRYGRPEATHEQVVAAAEAAHVADFVADLPDGYATMVGERGVGLSGGQKQRVAIARALLLDPRILILDDATSSVDAENEYLIRQALQRLMAGRTSFIIAHRLASVMFADRIVVLEEGRVAATGTHAELLESNGLYRNIYELQLAPAEGLVGGGLLA